MNPAACMMLCRWRSFCMCLCRWPIIMHHRDSGNGPAANCCSLLYADGAAFPFVQAEALRSGCTEALTALLLLAAAHLEVWKNYQRTGRAHAKALNLIVLHSASCLAGSTHGPSTHAEALRSGDRWLLQMMPVRCWFHRLREAS